MCSYVQLSKIALIGNYLPRKCGIATFTCDLRRALTQQGAGPECFVVAVNDRPEGYAYSPDVRFEIAEQELLSYRLAADFLQSANVDVPAYNMNLAFTEERLVDICSHCFGDSISRSLPTSIQFSKTRVWNKWM